LLVVSSIALKVTVQLDCEVKSSNFLLFCLIVFIG